MFSFLASMPDASLTFEYDLKHVNSACKGQDGGSGFGQRAHCAGYGLEGRRPGRTWARPAREAPNSAAKPTSRAAGEGSGLELLEQW